MNKQLIGENAGKIWKLLSSDNGRWKYDDIKRVTGLSDREINTAIGWLAREDKIELEVDHGCDCMCLTLNVYIG